MWTRCVSSGESSTRIIPAVLSVSVGGLLPTTSTRIIKRVIYRPLATENSMITAYLRPRHHSARNHLGIRLLLRVPNVTRALRIHVEGRIDARKYSIFSSYRSAFSMMDTFSVALGVWWTCLVLHRVVSIEGVVTSQEDNSEMKNNFFPAWLRRSCRVLTGLSRCSRNCDNRGTKFKVRDTPLRCTAACDFFEKVLFFCLSSPQMPSR